MSKRKFTLVQARQYNGLTLRAVAKLVGVHYQTIRNWELGITKISIDSLKKLCEVYGIDPTDIKI